MHVRLQHPTVIYLVCGYCAPSAAPPLRALRGAGLWLWAETERRGAARGACVGSDLPLSRVQRLVVMIHFVLCVDFHALAAILGIRASSSVVWHARARTARAISGCWVYGY